jgi:hypothetical protein
MTWTGLTEEQRARAGDACSAALGELTRRARPGGRPWLGSDVFLDQVEAATLLIAELDALRNDYAVEAALRGATWQQVGDAVGMTRQSATSRWKEAAEAERAARLAERAARTAAGPAPAGAHA